MFSLDLVIGHNLLWLKSILYPSSICQLNKPFSGQLKLFFWQVESAKIFKIPDPAFVRPKTCEKVESSFLLILLQRNKEKTMSALFRGFRLLTFGGKKPKRNKSFTIISFLIYKEMMGEYMFQRSYQCKHYLVSCCSVCGSVGRTVASNTRGP